MPGCFRQWVLLGISPAQLVKDFGTLVFTGCYARVFRYIFTLMKYLGQSASELLNNRGLFEEIHQLKSFFVHLFSGLANEMALDYLSSAHTASQGVKISKGNELEHCPYQVLDIVRDFDKNNGFNIRIMNWWGRGLFVILFTGYHNRRLSENPQFITSMQHRGYLLVKTSSPWDYKRMVDEGRLQVIPSAEQLNTHIDQLKYFQVLKKMEYTADPRELKLRLKDQVEHILKYYVA